MKRKVRNVFLGILFWIWSLTWGCLMTIPGLLITAFCIIFLKGKPHKNGFSYIVEIGGNWGGLELGAVALCGNYSDTYSSFYNHTRCHEGGHNIQQLILGPLQAFIVGIPSAARYWYIRKHPEKNIEYDQIWFEYTASKWGTSYVNWVEGTDYKYTFVRK